MTEWYNRNQLHNNNCKDGYKRHEANLWEWSLDYCLYLITSWWNVLIIIMSASGVNNSKNIWDSWSLTSINATVEALDRLAFLINKTRRSLRNATAKLSLPFKLLRCFLRFLGDSVSTSPVKNLSCNIMLNECSLVNDWKVSSAVSSAITSIFEKLAQVAASELLQII